MSVGFIVGLLLAIAVIEEAARLLLRDYRRVSRIQKRFGLSKREAKRFDAWLRIRFANSNLPKGDWDWDSITFDAYYQRWVEEFIERPSTGTH